MRQPDEDVRKCPEPRCGIPIACDNKGIVPYHLRRGEVGLFECEGCGLTGEAIKEGKKSK